MRFDLYQHYAKVLPEFLRDPGDLLGDMQRGMREAVLNALAPSAISVAYERAQREMDFCCQHSISILRYDEADYPSRLKQCADAPLHLFYRGTADLCQRPSISVVGTRQVTQYGKDMCLKIIRELAAINPHLLVVSGLAYGVDIHAHRASLDNHLDTVGVVAHGMDTLYPPLHRPTAREMMAHGGILTEYMSGVAPDKMHFVRRNRIVAGLTSATLVIESAEKGGALITARLARGYNRDVMAVPGRITDPCSAGCNNLIFRKEAHAVGSGEDVARIMGWEPVRLSPKHEGRTLFEASLNSVQQQIVGVLRTQGVTLRADDIAAHLGVPANTVRSQLVDMEINGVINILPGDRCSLVV